MTLSIPESQMLDIILAGRVWPVVTRIADRRAPEQLLPAVPALQLIGMLQHVSGLMTQDAHALRHGSAFDIDDLLALEPDQAWMGQIKRNSDSGRGVRAKPLVRDPSVRAHPNPALFELVVEFAEAALEPRAFDGHFEVPEAQPEELLVG